MTVSNLPILFGGLGTGEIILILAVLLIFFGAKRIPELARGLGKGIREFKDASTDIRSQIERETDVTSTPPPTAQRPPVAAERQAPQA